MLILATTNNKFENDYNLATSLSPQEFWKVVLAKSSLSLQSNLCCLFHVVSAFFTGHLELNAPIVSTMLVLLDRTLK